MKHRSGFDLRRWRGPGTRSKRQFSGGRGRPVYAVACGTGLRTGGVATGPLCNAKAKSASTASPRRGRGPCPAGLRLSRKGAGSQGVGRAPQGKNPHRDRRGPAAMAALRPGDGPDRSPAESGAGAARGSALGGPLHVPEAARDRGDQPARRPGDASTDRQPQGLRGKPGVDRRARVGADRQRGGDLPPARRRIPQLSGPGLARASAPPRPCRVPPASSPTPAVTHSPFPIPRRR